MILKKLAKLSTVLSIGLNLSCGHVDVKDIEVCGDLGPAGAHCANTLTDIKRDISKTVWDGMRVGYLCMDSTSFNDLITPLDQLCATTSLCDYETRTAIDATTFRLNKVVSRALKARNKKK